MLAKAERPLLVIIPAIAAVMLVMPSGFRPVSQTGQIVLGSAVVVLLSLASLAVVLSLPDAASGISSWRLGPWYLLWTMLAFGIASFTWVRPQNYPASQIDLAHVTQALFLFGLSIPAWTAGYVLGPRSFTRTAKAFRDFLFRGTAPVVRGGTATWVLYGLGTAARLLDVGLSGRLGYVGDPTALVSQATSYAHVLHLFSTLTFLALAGAAHLNATRPTPSTRFTMWTLFTAEAGIGALAGWKEMFILATLAILVPYAVARGRLPLPLMVAGALLFLWVVVPFNINYRQAVRGSVYLGPSAAIAIAPDTLSEVVFGQSPGTAIAASSVTVLERVRLIDSLAIITQRTPAEIPYRSPLEFAAAPLVSVIPRAIWPGKPVFANGYQFSQEYYHLPSTIYTSTAITPAGDLFRHGGAAVLAVGLCLLGVMCRLFDKLFRPERDPRALFFLLVFLPIIVKSEIDIYNLMLSVPASVVAAWIGIRVLCHTERAAQ